MYLFVICSHQVVPVGGLPGPSNIVRGIGEVPSSAKLHDHSKPPLITQYAPQLPVGPGLPPFMHYPPVTPHSGVAPPTVPDVAHLKQEREEQQQMALWQQHQQQQQQWAVAIQLKQLAEQQQLHQLVIPPGSAHHPASFMPVVTSHGHASHTAEPMAFTFNPEEVAALRSGGARVGALPAGIEQLAAAGLIPPGQQFIQSTPVPFIDSYQLAMSARLQEEHQGGLIQLIQAGIPAGIEQQQQLLLAQHQQVLAHVAALNSTSPPELMDFLQRSELIAAQIQKDPGLLQDPNVQMMLKRREVLIQQIQQLAAIQMEQMQRMQQEAILHQHQEMLQKQQQQQFILTRPPLPEEVHSRNRPGVIVGHK